MSGKGGSLHDFDVEQLSGEQRQWAERANDIHARMQIMLMQVAVSDAPLMQTLLAVAKLDQMGGQLTHANLQLWTATAAPARRVLRCADRVVRHLADPFSSRSLSGVVINARYTAVSLLAMTDAQRRTMLSMPAVAQACDIDHDCTGEFDNREQWAKWVRRAHPQRALENVAPILRDVCANDNQARGAGELMR